jgi:uncharacterized damage-inducible protein DinB
VGRPGEDQAQRLENVYQDLEVILQRPEAAGRLRTAPGEGEWSAMQILAHMVEMIPYWLSHCQMVIAAEGELPQIGRSLDAPERLEGVERASTEDLEGLLGQLETEVRVAAAAIRQMSTAEREKKAVYLNGDELTVADILEIFIVSHSESHFSQLEEAVQK